MDKRIIQQIKDATDIVQVVQACGTKLTRRGHVYVGICPFHRDSNPSLTVSVMGKWANTYKCWPCSKSGDAINFIQETMRVSFPEAVAFAARLAGLQHLLDKK